MGCFIIFYLASKLVSDQSSDAAAQHAADAVEGHGKRKDEGDMGLFWHVARPFLHHRTDPFFNQLKCSG
jgi:hypothetical protein